MKPFRPTDKRAELEEALTWLLSSEAGQSIPALAMLVDRLRPKPLDNIAQARQHLQLLQTLLDSRDSYKTALRRHILGLFSRPNQTRFFSDGGILPGTGFFTELRHTIARRLLPDVIDENSLRDGLAQVFRHPKDHLWLSQLTMDDLAGLRQTLALGHPGSNSQWQHSRAEMLDAALLLSHRISALGMEPELLRLCPHIEKFDSPFFAQANETGSFVAAAMQTGQPNQEDRHDTQHIRVLLTQCRTILTDARKRSGATGTSLSLTWLLARLEQLITRLEHLLDVLEISADDNPDTAQTSEDNWHRNIGRIIVADTQRRSLSLLFSEITSLLALRVTENASKTGEHYISRDRASYISMWRSAAGAGVIIALLALIKISIGKMGLAPANSAILYSLNYGLGFVLIYLLHLTIATKQPAMTASTLASAISQTGDKKSDLTPLATMVVDLLRTQLAAIGGNLSLAIITAIGVGSLIALGSGAPAIDAEKAHHLLHDLSPTDSLALFHAAIAGVFLFFSGLITGYFDNLASHSRLAERIHQLKWLRYLLGDRGAAGVGEFVGNKLGGISGNFLFGIMLGTTATIGFLFGLPLDIRHIAFASANFGYAISALDFHLPGEIWLKSIIGIAAVGAVNLAVSFSLTLWVALRSRGVTWHHGKNLVRAVVWQLLKNPLALFVTPQTNHEQDQSQQNK